MSGTSWIHRAFRDLVFLLAGLLALLVVAAAGLWWWSGTEGSLAWTLQRLARYQPLTAQGVSGSLREGARIEQLHWQQPGGLDVTATGVHLEWQPLALLRSRQLRLDVLQAQQLRVEDHRPPAPSQPPQRLELPLEVQAQELKIGHIEWVKSGSTVAVDDVAGSYRYDGSRHEVKLDSLRWAGGQYQGEASLGASGAMPLDARLRGRFQAPVPAGPQALPLEFTARLQGPLRDFEASGQLNAPTLRTGAPPGAANSTAAVSATANATATATARVTPWAAQPLAQAEASFRQLDLAALWPERLPHTLLNGQASVQPATTATWVVSADISNAIAGPWNRSRLPLEQLTAQGEWHAGGAALLRSAQARLGGGRLEAHGQWRGTAGWQVEATLSRVDPSALHTALASLPLSGSADAKGEGSAIAFDVDLKAASGRATRAKRSANPVSAAVQALELRHARARGRWDKGQLSLPAFDLLTADASARGALDIALATRAASGRVAIEVPGLQGRIEGKLAETSGRGNGVLKVVNMDQALRWIQRLPMVPAALQGLDLAGRGDARIDWQGGWRDPNLQARVALPQLEVRSVGASADPATGGAPWVLHNTVATVDGRLSDAAFGLQGSAEQAQRRLGVNLSGRGGRRSRSPEVWQGRIADLRLSASDSALGNGAWRLISQRPFDWRFAGGSIDAGGGEALLVPPQAVGAAAAAPAVLAWDPVRWRTGELKTSGRLSGLPLAWLAFVGGPQLAGSAISGDMVFDARWDASLGATPRLQATIARQRGDLTLSAQTAQGASAQVAAGVREASLSLTSDGAAVTLALKWDSLRAGEAQARIATRLARGGAAGWTLPEDAPLDGSLRARLPRIGVWSLLAPPGWRLRGSLDANIAVAGTRSQPRLTGSVAADDLALRSVVDGFELQGGQLRARLDGQRLLIDQFTLHGAGNAGQGGSVVASGEGEWTAGGPRARLSAQLNRLRASTRSDRQLTLSGTIVAAIDAHSTEVNGKLLVDQALIVLPEQSAARLGDDVVVHGLDEPITRKQASVIQQAEAKGARRVQLNVDLDLGSDFRVEGHGIDTHLRGTLALTGHSFGSPQVNGVIRADGGKYQAYGQDLDIERGVVRFTGAIDNPSLDVLAIRPRLTQRVGVQVTGTVLAPFVRLYAEPDIPDVDKLSWLVVGRASPQGGVEAALLQEAALALAAGRSGGGKRGVVASLGLDELSFQRQGPNGPAVTLGKQLGRHIYAAYERSLSGALGTLQVFYDLTSKLKVRAEAGERSAVDLIYTLTFN